MKAIDVSGDSRYLKRICQKMNQYQIWESIFPWQENWPKLR